MMSTGWLRPLRRMFVGSRHELVGKAETVSQDKLQCSGSEYVVAKTLRERAASSQANLLVGRSATSGEDIRVAVDDLVGVSRWTTGSTGSGKSAQTLGEILQLIRPSCPWPLILVDGKSEMSEWLTRSFLPATLAGWSERAQADLLSRFRVINPFDGDNLPEFNVLKPVPGLSHALQAKEVAVLLAESLGPANSGFGPRMITILTFALRLALELGGLSLLEVRSLLTNRNYLDGLLRFATSQDIKEFFVYRFPKESTESIHAVVSRLDLLLLVEDTSRVLCAPGSLALPDALEDGMSIIDIGSPPRGAEHLSGFWMGVLVRGLARAIMGRPLTPATKPVFCVMDEWWTGVDEELAYHFERLLTLCRFKKVGLWLINQLPGQIGSRFPQLLGTLKNSCGVQIAFRQSHEDAKALAYMMPSSGATLVPRTQGAASWDQRLARPEEERKAHVAELARLTERHFWFYFKKRGLEAIKLVAPTVGFEVAFEAADKVQPALREACLGRNGISRQRLDEVLEHRRAHMSAVAEGSATSACPDFDRLATEIAVVEHEARDDVEHVDPEMIVVEEPVVAVEPDPVPIDEVATMPLPEPVDEIDGAFPFLG